MVGQAEEVKSWRGNRASLSKHTWAVVFHFFKFFFTSPSSLLPQQNTHVQCNSLSIQATSFNPFWGKPNWINSVHQLLKLYFNVIFLPLGKRSSKIFTNPSFSFRDCLRCKSHVSVCVSRRGKHSYVYVCMCAHRHAYITCITSHLIRTQGNWWSHE